MKLSELGRILSEGDDHGHDHGHDEEGGDLLVARIIMIVVILIAALPILLPYTKFVRKSSADMHEEQTDTKVCSGRLQQYSICFASGMLLSLSLVHILPEALEMYASY